MKILTECSGPCLTCSATGFCLAGHGDDDYHRASPELLRAMLQTKKWGGKPTSRDLDERELAVVQETLEKATP